MNYVTVNFYRFLTLLYLVGVYPGVSRLVYAVGVITVYVLKGVQ